MAYQFYQLDGMATIVWDRERDCALCEFVGRKLSVDDERVAAVLRELGYPERGNSAASLDTLHQMATIESLPSVVVPTSTSDDAPSPQQIAEAAVLRAAVPDTNLVVESSDADTAAGMTRGK